MMLLSIFTDQDTSPHEVKVEETHNIRSRCQEIAREGLFMLLEGVSFDFIPPHRITRIQVREV